MNQYVIPTLSSLLNLIPTIPREHAYFYKGELPELMPILSTIHPNYLFVALSFVFVFFVLYIKMKYPFWNQVPAFHTYDIHRRFYSKPYIINNLPKRTKYYESAPLICSARFQDIPLEKREEMVASLQSNYLPSDRVFCSIQLADLEAQMGGSIVSVYNQITGIQGFLSSRIVSISVALNDLVVLEPAEYVDYICFDKSATTPKKLRSLFHTHEYNQRMIRPANKMTIFKKCTDLIDALVPLVQYDEITFYMRHRIQPDPLPTNWQMVRIQREHQHHLYDFVERVASLRNAAAAGFSLAIVPEIGEIVKLLNTGQMFIYALRGPDGVLDKKLDAVYALYFFRNAHMKYEDLDGADTVSCVAAFKNTADDELFFKGFVMALREVKTTIPSSKMLMMDDIGHVRPLVARMALSHDIVLRTPCAYYLSNYVVPKSPMTSEQSLVIV